MRDLNRIYVDTPASGQGNSGGVTAHARYQAGEPASLELVLPPLATLILIAEDEQG